MSSPAAKVVPVSDPVAVNSSPSGPKPCCVCKQEKAARDECFLFSTKGGEVECVDTITAYKKCMAGYGFKI